MKLTDAQLDQIERIAEKAPNLPGVATTLALIAEVRELRRQREKVIKDSRDVIRQHWDTSSRFRLGTATQARVTLAFLDEKADTASILGEAS